MQGHALPGQQRAELSSVANAVRLIKAFSNENDTIGITALAARLQLAKSTVHRLASNLVKEGLLEQAQEGGKYRLGLGLFELGALVRRNLKVTDEARIFLKELAHRTDETLYLAVHDRQAVLYINIIESRRAIRIGYGVGTRAPLHCTAAGKILLAFQPQGMIESVISGGLPRLTRNTITNPEDFRSELAAARARGYAVEDEETEMGLRGIAAAVRSASGQVIAAIGIAGPARRLTAKQLLSHSKDITVAADAISRRIGQKFTNTHRLDDCTSQQHKEVTLRHNRRVEVNGNERYRGTDIPIS